MGSNLGNPVQDLDRLLHTEWLCSNEAGDYASGTVIGCNTRRYHGLLVANVEHFGRHVLLSNVEDWLIAGGAAYPLSSRSHPGTMHPQGHVQQTDFARRPCPTFTFECGPYTVTRCVMLRQDQHACLVRWTVETSDKKLAKEPVKLQAAPLLAYRYAHNLTHANMDLQVKTYPARRGFKIQPYNALPPFFVQVEGDFDFLPSPDWIYNVEYLKEEERLLEHAEDLFSPGVFEITLLPGQSVYMQAGTDENLPKRGEPDAPDFISTVWDREMKVRWQRHPDSETLLDYLRSESHIFLIKDAMAGDTLLAGYHWYGTWSRDTLISLPGIAFQSGRIRQGASILKRLTAHMSDGLVPNSFSHSGHPYGWDGVDASLWYAWCCQQLAAAAQAGTKDDKEAWNEIAGYCADAVYSIVDAYRNGRVHFVSCDKDGFLDVGTPTTNLTWMNIQVDGRPVTPRWGYPVEMEALWYNTLAYAHKLALKRRDPDPCPAKELARMRKVFEKRFLKEDGTLYDVWRSMDDGGPDGTIRPNQLLAFSLPEPPMDPAKAGPVLALCQEKLLTPFGLRTLNPENAEFRPKYRGSMAHRGRAYHQGTVWPWLLGPYCETLLRHAELACGDKASAKAAKAKAAKGLLGTVAPLFSRHLSEAGRGHISELFSATDPHNAHGCVAKAWSEGEVIRMLKLLRDCDPEAYERWEKRLQWRNK
ncbi:MAG: glycogen debranching enzyme N-terminal domain-containing protein [Desulfovibrio sp.]|nr:glycogen debranching enzyme N-terminal domain-containing protein [Desulfovibrio sp.]